MYLNQHLSILFYLKRRKVSKDGMVPVYVRITIDGLEAEISSGCKVFPGRWDNTSKSLALNDPNSKTVNKKIAHMKTDLERHFDLVQVKQGLATPKAVFDSYKTPFNGAKLHQHKIENLQLSDDLDALIAGFIEYSNKYVVLDQMQPEPCPLRMKLLATEKEQICRKVDKFRKTAHAIFYGPDREKTLMLTMNEYLLDLLLLCINGERSFRTLEKLMCRKRVYIEYLRSEYKGEDVILQKLDHVFLKGLYHFLLAKKEIIHNTATKYIQIIKGIMNRAVVLKWININPFLLYRCTYHDVHHDWLDMEQFERLLDYYFDVKKLNVIRDIFVFASFTGFSYNELAALRKQDIVKGDNGKLWISKNRKKTGEEESVPLLPIPLRILEKYKNSTACRMNKLLPVPTVQEFNRCLKSIACELEIKINLRTHKARFFFANEIAYNNGVPLKTVSRLLGQKSVKTTEIYVQANKKNISENMDMVERKLFTREGNFIQESIVNDSGAKVIDIRQQYRPS